MARLNLLSVDDSDEDLPCLSDLIGEAEGAASVKGAPDKRKEQIKLPAPVLNPSHLKRVNGSQEDLREERGSDSSQELILRLRSINDSLSNACIRESPRRAAKKLIDYSKFTATIVDTELSFSEDDDDDTTDLSGFIVSDSENLDENVDPLVSRQKKRPSPNKSQAKRVANTKSKTQPSLLANQDFQVVDLVSPTRHISGSQESCDSHGGKHFSSRPPSSDLSDGLAILRL